MAVTTGDPYDQKTWEYQLLDFDLKNISMDVLIKEKDDYMFSTMDSFDDDLLLIRSVDDGMCVDKFDIAKKENTTLKKFKFKNEETGLNEALRAIYCKDDVISLLRLSIDAEENSVIFLDKYDKNMKLLSSTDISEIFNIDDDETNNSERCQPVFGFFSQDELLYYENRSTTTFLCKIEQNGSLTPLVDIGDSIFESAMSVSKDESHKLFGFLLEKDNPLFILDTDSGEVSSTNLKIKDERFSIDSMYQYDDKVMIEMMYKPEDASSEREDRLYYTNIDDLL